MQNYYLLQDCCNIDRQILIIIPQLSILPNGIYDFDIAAPLNLNSVDLTQPEYIVEPGYCYKLTFRGVTNDAYNTVLASLIDPVLDSGGIQATDCNDGVTCTDCETGQYYIKADPCCEGDAIFFRGEPYVGGSQGGSMPSFNINNYNGVETYTPVNISTSTSIIPGYPLIPNQCYTWSIGVVGDGLSGAPATLAEYDLLFYPPDANAELTFVFKGDCESSEAI